MLEPALKVSVVVPVFNAGDYLERCAPSLLEQTIGSDAYEVIYVNDGSTDDSEKRLARLTEEHPHARYLTQPNSGWPGKPRNVGIAASTAEYIQFVDQDDELAPQALERLYAMGARNRADIVIGKVSGSMALPNPVFRRNVELGTVADVSAMESLTGHKMFRRAFLEEHSIRFPEGYWRMEDMLFVARAYAHHPRISVLADQVCYWWHRRDDGQNNSETPFTLSESYERRRVIIDTVREATEPGELQDQLLRPLYRTLMRRVGERSVASDPHGAWLRALPHISALARECFPPGVRDGLPATQRLLGLLAEREDQRALYTLSKRIVDLNPVIQRRKARVDRNGIFGIQVKYSLNLPNRGSGPRALTIVDGPDGWSLDHELTDGIAEFHPFGAGDPLLGAKAELLLEDRERHAWWYPPSELTPAVESTNDGRHRVVLSGELSIDPGTAAAGKPLPPGTYAVWFFGRILGTVRRRLLVMPRATDGRPRWTVSVSAPLVTRFNWGGDGARLQLEVRDRQEWLAENLRADRKTTFDSGLALPVRVAGRLPAGPVPVTLSIAEQPVVAELSAGPRRGYGWLELPPHADLGPGAHPAFVAGAPSSIGKVDFTPTRLVWVAPATKPSRRPAPSVAAQTRAKVQAFVARFAGRKDR